MELPRGGPKAPYTLVEYVLSQILLQFEFILPLDQPDRLFEGRRDNEYT